MRSRIFTFFAAICFGGVLSARADVPSTRPAAYLEAESALRDPHSSDDAVFQAIGTIRQSPVQYETANLWHDIAIILHPPRGETNLHWRFYWLNVIMSLSEQPGSWLQVQYFISRGRKDATLRVFTGRAGRN